MCFGENEGFFLFGHVIVVVFGGFINVRVLLTSNLIRYYLVSFWCPKHPPTNPLLPQRKHSKR